MGLVAQRHSICFLTHHTFDLCLFPRRVHNRPIHNRIKRLKARDGKWERGLNSLLLTEGEAREHSSAFMYSFCPPAFVSSTSVGVTLVRSELDLFQICYLVPSTVPGAMLVLSDSRESISFTISGWQYSLRVSVSFPTLQIEDKKMWEGAVAIWKFYWKFSK